jgi:3-oxoacyl-[acyl-carrier-protein] synthase-3
VVGPAGHDERPGIGPTAAGSAGDLVDTIVVADRNSFIRQEGQEVYRWANTKIAPVALQALELAGLAPADVDVLVPHQANLRIVEAIARRMQAAGAREDIVWPTISSTRATRPQRRYPRAGPHASRRSSPVR